MSDDVDDDPAMQWTDESRTRLAEAASTLIAAIDVHREALLAAGTAQTHASRTKAAVSLENAAISYSEAQFDLTGNGYPFGKLESREDKDDDSDKSDEPDEPVQLVSVLYRADYGVADEEQLKLAGQAAYRRMNPGRSDEEAEREIGLGAALYQLTHLNGLESLNSIPGLLPIGAVTQVIKPADSPEHEDAYVEPTEPNSAFSAGGSVLYTSEDRW